jgi:hypothetical protein
VIIGVVELAMSLILETTTSAVRMVRVVRLVRMVRVVRILRIARFFHSLRVLVGAMVVTIKSCVWTSLLLLMIMYTFGIIFAQGVHVHLVMDDEAAELDACVPQTQSLRFHFGSLSRAIFTLFQSVVGGLDWGEAAFTLSDVSPALVGFFVIYIIFVSLAVMNVVTGVFLQSALEQASQDHDHVIQQQLRAKAIYVDNLERLFHDLDSSKDGSITLDEFEERMGEEKMQAFLQTLEINASDAWTFFKLLDEDNGGSLDLSEFVDGCFRLRGNAKSIHVAQIMYENRWIMNKLTDICQTLLDEDHDEDFKPPYIMWNNPKTQRASAAEKSWRNRLSNNGKRGGSSAQQSVKSEDSIALGHTKTSASMKSVKSNESMMSE